MNTKAFFVAALSSALELGIGTPDDVLRHVTPDVLANHLPRPLWARLLTACVGAPSVDAQLVLETVGVPNLCEHMPQTVIWAILADLGSRALGGEVARTAPVTSAAPATPPTPLTIDSPPPPEPPKATPAPAAALGPNIPAPSASPLDELVADLEKGDRPSPPTRARSPSQRFRPSNTGIGRLAANNSRRPQAVATAPEPAPATDVVPERRPRRAETEVEVEVETQVGAAREDWRSSLAVEDEQLVDWSASDETTTAGDDPAFGRKR